MNRGELWAGQLGGGGRARWQDGSGLRTGWGACCTEQSACAPAGRGWGPAPGAEPGEGRFPARSEFLTPPLVLQRQAGKVESSLLKGPPLRTAAQTPSAKHPTPSG